MNCRQERELARLLLLWAGNSIELNLFFKELEEEKRQEIRDVEKEALKQQIKELCDRIVMLEKLLAVNYNQETK